MKTTSVVTELDNASRSVRENTSCDDKMRPTLGKSFDYSIRKRSAVVEQTTAWKQPEIHASVPLPPKPVAAPAPSQRTSEAALKTMRFDEKTWMKCRPQDFGMLDFVAQKTQEFIFIQKQLQHFDHNSLSSDRKHYLDKRADMIMKNIALKQDKRWSKCVKNGSYTDHELFDLN